MQLVVSSASEKDYEFSGRYSRRENSFGLNAIAVGGVGGPVEYQGAELPRLFAL